MTGQVDIGRPLCRICGNEIASGRSDPAGRAATLCSEECLREAIMGYWAERGRTAQVSLEDGYARLTVVSGLYPFATSDMS